MIEVGLPVSMIQSCGKSDEGAACDGQPELGLENFEGGGFGDLRLGLRGQILPAERYAGFGLGASLAVSFPTANATAFVGEGSRADLEDPESDEVFSPTGTFHLISDYVLGHFRFGPQVSTGVEAPLLISMIFRYRPAGWIVSPMAFSALRKAR